jgi:hypothetical protein
MTDETANAEHVQLISIKTPERGYESENERIGESEDRRAGDWENRRMGSFL